MQLTLFSDTVPEENRLTPERRTILLNSPIIAFDIETSNADYSDVKSEIGQTYFSSKNLGLSFCAKLIFLSLWCPEYPAGIALTGEDMLAESEFLYALSHSNNRFVAHNLTFDLRILAGKHGFAIPSEVWDTMTIEILFAEGDPKVDKKRQNEADYKEYNLFFLTKFYDILGFIEGTPGGETSNAYIKYLFGQTVSTKRRKELLKDRMLVSFEQLTLSERALIYKEFKTKQRAFLENLPIEYRLQAGAKYAILDTLYTYYLQQIQDRRVDHLENQGYAHLRELVEWENRFSRVCAHMAARGIELHIPALTAQYQAWLAECAEIKERLVQYSLEFVENNRELALSRLKPLVEYKKSRGKALLSFVIETRDHPESELEEVQAKVIKGAKDNPLNQMSLWDADALESLVVEKYTPESLLEVVLKDLDIDTHIGRFFLLFVVFGIEVPRYDARHALFYTEKYLPTFNDDTLPKYAAKYGELLLDYGTYIQHGSLANKALEFLGHAACDGKIHSQVVARTVTGRTSADTPNQQNVKIASTFKGMIRSSPQNGKPRIVISADITNAEIYTSAIIARDNAQATGLVEGDVHAYAAKNYFRTLYDFNLGPKEGVNDKLRDLAKTVNFGTAYGMGAVKLVNKYPAIAEIMLPTEEQVERIQKDKRFIQWCQFDKVNVLPQNLKLATEDDWIYAGQIANARDLLKQKDNTFWATTEAKADAMRYAEEMGYVVLWSGRRCYIRMIRYWDTDLKKYVSKRESKNAWNSLCQGGVGEVIRRWSIKLVEEFEKYPQLEAYLIAYIHDEVVYECPVEYEHIVSQIVVNKFYEVFDTFPPDERGMRWFTRTDPQIPMRADVDHKDNIKKWGTVVGEEYPLPKDLAYKVPDEAKVQELLRNL